MGYPSFGDGGKIARNPRERVLKSALEYVSKDRNTAYGEPEDNFQNIADVWNGMGFQRDDGDPITATDVAKLMIGMKLARLKHNPTHEDSWVDIAGYAACGMQSAERTEPRGEVITEGPFKGWRELGYTTDDGLVYSQPVSEEWSKKEITVVNEGAHSQMVIPGVMPEYQARVAADIEAVKRVADQHASKPMIGLPVRDDPQA